MLTKLRKDENRKGGYSIYRCVCGVEKSIRTSAVNSGNTKSCGCHRRKIAVENGKCVTTHGKTGTPEYQKWSDLKCKKDFSMSKEWSEDFLKFWDFIKEEWESGKTGISIKDGYSELNKDSIILTNPLDSKILNTRRTSIKKYGVDHHSKRFSEREKVRDRYRIYDGKTTTELSEEIGFSKGHINRLIKKYGYENLMDYDPTISSLEVNVGNILDKSHIKYIRQFRVEKQFADIFIPSHNIVIECDGIYWHSDAVNNDNRYHVKKRRLYLSNGYKPLFFRGDEINNNSHIIESIIHNSLGVSRRIFARKCKVVEVDKDCRNRFFKQNHLMGKGSGRCFALKYNDEIVCGLQFVKRQEYTDVSRFCTKLGMSVVGGYSRLLKQIERDHFPKAIQTFVDLRYGSGNYLNKLGFKKESEHVSFRWVKNNQTFHRMKFPGNSGYDSGCFKLWDCGQAKFVKRT